MRSKAIDPELGRRIRVYREKRGLTRRELEIKLNECKNKIATNEVKGNRVANWEMGLNAPTADSLADICRILDVSPSELLGVKLSTDELNAQEREVIGAYRAKPEMQSAVNTLLGIEDKA